MCADLPSSTSVVVPTELDVVNHPRNGDIGDCCAERHASQTLKLRIEGKERQWTIFSLRTRWDEVNVFMSLVLGSSLR